MTWTAAVTLAIATLGAVLGLVNTWQSIDRDRVKLRVAVRFGYFFIGQQQSVEPQLAIEVVNRSPFALTISQIGLEVRGSEKRLVLIDPILPDGGRIPRRLESRSAFTAYFSTDATRGLTSHNVSRAYANTDSGDVAYSSRRSLRKLVDSLPR